MSVANEGVIDAFVAAWNVTDEADCSRLLEQCWADDGTLINHTAQQTGRAEVAAYIRHVTPQWEGGRVRISSVDEHHGWLRYTWKVVRPDGSAVGEGMHVAERAPDGRLRRVIGFPSPAPVVA